MDFITEYLSTPLLLTIPQLVVLSHSLLKVNKPIVPRRGVLPVERKGIITLTLVISRESPKSPVTRGFCVMWPFKVKTKIKYKMEEYLKWKEGDSSYIAEAHKIVLTTFVNTFEYKDISDIKTDDIQIFYNQSGTNYNKTKAMEAIRAFLRWTRKEHSIDPETITNKGIVLTYVGQNDKIEPIMKRKPGRKLNVELVKKVKLLKDKGNLSYRQISKALGKDVKSVYYWYQRDLLAK